MKSKGQIEKTTVALVMLFLFSSWVNAQVEVNTFSPHQVKPGSTFEVVFDVQNLDWPASSSSGTSISSDDENSVTVNEIYVENPFSQESGGIGIQEVSSFSQAVAANLLPAGAAIHAKEELYDEVLENITNGYYELYDIPLDGVLDDVSDKEAELDEVIEKSEVKTKIRLEVPEDYPEGTTITIPATITYTQNGALKTITREVTVTTTNNPTAKRAIIVIIDAGRPDYYYQYANQEGGIKTLLQNGVKFTKANTIFPSITTASHTTIMTGIYPNQTQIPAFRWYDKDSKEIVAEGDGLEPVKFQLNLDGGVDEYIESKTIYEQLDKKITNFDGLSVFEFVTKGGEYVGANSRMQAYLLLISKLGGDIGDDRFKRYSMELDSEANSLALDSFDSSLDVMAVWFVGTDEISHHAGPSSSETREVMDNVNEQLQRLIDGLPAGVVDETVFVITSDHGQTDVLADDVHAVSRDELEAELTGVGYKIAFKVDNMFFGPWIHDYENSNAVAVHNGGIAMLYVKHGGVWGGEPSWSEVVDAVNAFVGKPYVKEILVKSGGKYKIYDNGLRDIVQSDFPEDSYPNALERIQGLYSERSGDVILVADYPHYFDDKPSAGTHGNLDAEDSYVPLIFSGPGIKHGKTIDVSARTVDIAPTIANLLGASLENVDGRVLTEIYASSLAYAGYSTLLPESPRCGDTVNIGLALKNSGKDTARQVTARLETSLPTPVPGTGYSDMAPGETRNPLQDMQVNIPAGYKGSASINIKVDYSDSAGEKYSYSFPIQLAVGCETPGGTPQLAYKSKTVRGDLSCGSDNIELGITLENTGGGNAREVTATLSSGNQEVDVWDSTIDCGIIGAGAVKDCDSIDNFNIDLGQVQGSIPLNLRVEYEDEAGQTHTLNQDLTIEVACTPQQTGNLRVKQYHSGTEWYSSSEHAGVRCGIEHKLKIELENTGVKNAYSVKADLTATQASVEITDGRESYGSWISQDGGTAVSRGDYSFIVDDGYEGPIDLTVTAEYEDYLGNTHTSTDYISLNAVCPSNHYTGNPLLEFIEIGVDDDREDSSYGNSNRIAECMEHLELSPAVKNVGGGTAIELIATLTTDDPRITVINQTIKKRNIDPSKLWYFQDFDVIIPAGFNDKVTLKLRVGYDSNPPRERYILEKDIDLDVSCNEVVRLSKRNTTVEDYSIIDAVVSDGEGGLVEGTYVAFIPEGDVEIMPSGTVTVLVNTSQPSHTLPEELMDRGYDCVQTGVYRLPCSGGMCILVMYETYECTKEYPKCSSIQETDENGKTCIGIKTDRETRVTAVSLGGGMDSITLKTQSSPCIGSIPPEAGIWFVGLDTFCRDAGVSLSDNILAFTSDAKLTLENATIKFN